MNKSVKIFYRSLNDNNDIPVLEGEIQDFLNTLDPYAEVAVTQTIQDDERTRTKIILMTFLYSIP